VIKDLDIHQINLLVSLVRRWLVLIYV